MTEKPCTWPGTKLGQTLTTVIVDLSYPLGKSRNESALRKTNDLKIKSYSEILSEKKKIIKGEYLCWKSVYRLAAFYNHLNFIERKHWHLQKNGFIAQARIIQDIFSVGWSVNSYKIQNSSENMGRRYILTFN